MMSGPWCARHPGRRAVDACPRCGRLRCLPDVERWPAGCGACLGTPARRRAAGSGERVVRGGLAALAAALLGGAIVTQYVDTHVFSLVAPALLGISCGWVTEAAAGRRRRWAVIAAAVGALLGTGLGFRLVPGGPGVLSSWREVGLPYLCAVGASLGWPLLSGPGRR